MLCKMYMAEISQFKLLERCKTTDKHQGWTLNVTFIHLAVCVHSCITITSWTFLCFSFCLLFFRDGIYTPQQCLSASPLLPPIFQTSALSSAPPPIIILILLFLRTSPLNMFILSLEWTCPSFPCPSLCSSSPYFFCLSASLAEVEVRAQGLEVPQEDKVARGEVAPRGGSSSLLSTLLAYQLFLQSITNRSTHSVSLSSWWATLVK